MAQVPNGIAVFLPSFFSNKESNSLEEQQASKQKQNPFLGRKKWFLVRSAARQLQQKQPLPCDSLKIAVHKLKCTCSIATFHSTAAASKSGTDAAAKQGTGFLLQHPWALQGSGSMET